MSANSILMHVLRDFEEYWQEQHYLALVCQYRYVIITCMQICTIRQS